jgi:RNA polymerase sigma-70 factor (ECF subfamily)
VSRRGAALQRCGARLPTDILAAMDDLTLPATTAEAALACRIAGAAPGAAHEAEAALYRLLAPRVRRYGLRHLRDADAACDLMQHVLVLTIEQLRAGQVREPERIVSFVFGTCRMTVLEMRRREKRREDLLALHGDTIAIADIAVAPRHDIERMADCLERLGERERTVLLLSFYEEQAADEVGVALGLSAGNVRVIRHRGIARLRDCLGASVR